MRMLRCEKQARRQAGTFFEKKVPKKTFAPAGVATGSALHRHRQRRA
jgi:hypothetical protein